MRNVEASVLTVDAAHTGIIISADVSSWRLIKGPLLVQDNLYGDETEKGERCVAGTGQEAKYGRGGGKTNLTTLRFSRGHDQGK